jgi:hypothetical protein
LIVCGQLEEQLLEAVAVVCEPELVQCHPGVQRDAADLVRVGVCQQQPIGAVTDGDRRRGAALARADGPGMPGLTARAGRVVRRRREVLRYLVALSTLSSASVRAAQVAIFSTGIHARPRRAVQATIGAIAATAVNCAIYTGAHGHDVFSWNFFLR